MGNNTTHLRPEVVLDLKDSTAFNEAELSDLYRQFLKDSDGKLYLTKEEFVKMYQNIFPSGDAAKFADHVFRTFDKTREGRINFRDFIITLSVQLRGTQAQKMEWLFDLYDYDQCGYIQKDELSKVLEVLQSFQSGFVPREEAIGADLLADHLMKRAKPANPDRLSKEEFMRSTVDSKTMSLILQGATTAASSPYSQRKARSGSFGRPRTGSFGKQ
eukprot:GHVT01037606.1.p1 GENE.GHVT01037606.1~~GHVT01037606.1.p1  ORF type:complete len:216 (+),score=17.59 GHVT01037606.1:383-1030(+)